MPPRKMSNGPRREGAACEPIAIIGIGCRFPGGVDGPESFWRRLSEGFDAITEVPPYRFDLEAVHDPEPGTPGKIQSRHGGFLGPVDAFDAAFFGISPREAPRVDPQQRLLLEVGWEALEDAGVTAERMPRGRAGVFLGMMANDYEDMMQRDPETLDLYGLNGGGRYGACGRLSFCFGMEGPSLCVDTACSSSLVSVHLACQSLRVGESDLALAGGSHLILQAHASVAISQGNILSADGRCKFGDVRADGFGRGEGAALVVLKRLADALVGGDRIYAVIRGSAVNSDGASNGQMATPSRVTQEAMLREAYRNAGVPPGRVRYIEAHGTGTIVGDRVELEALAAILREGREPGRPCLVGSVKTNIGHTEGASGIAGLIKLALCLRHRAIPRSLHCEVLNPAIPWAEIPLVMQREATVPWPADDPGPAVGGVNSFGLSGTNAHLVLEEPPRAAGPAPGPEVAARPFLVLLTASRPEALRALAIVWRDLLAEGVEDVPELADLAWTAALRQTHLVHRLALVATTREELREKLGAFLAGEPRSGLATGMVDPERRPRPVFVFPGQGSQWLGMGRELLAGEPVFRDALERCDAAIAAETGWSVLAELRAGEPESRLGEIDVVQPCLFALQVALAALWRAWGIEPASLAGHSMGEVAAAHVAGALSLEDAARVICRRSRLLRRVSGRGAMMLIELPMERAAEVIAGREDRVSIAVSNGPESTVLSGEPDALAEIAGHLEAEGVFCRRVKVDVASHSPQMEPLREDLLAALAAVAPRAGSVPILSTVTGEAVDGSGFDAAYWVRNLRQPVLFGAAVERLLRDGHGVFVEISAHPLLLPAVEQNLRRHGVEGGQGLPSLRREEGERGALLGSLGQLWALGHPVAWERVLRSGRPARLPAYPWQRERYWLRGAFNEVGGVASPRPRGSHPLLGAGLRPAFPPGLRIWETRLSPASPSWLADHGVRGAVLLPGAAWIEMGLAAAAEALGGVTRLATVQFEAALLLPPAEERTVQVVLAEEGEGVALRFFAREESGAWTLHATAAVVRKAGTAPPARDPEALRAGCGEELAGERHYQAARLRGLEYGPAFQGVDRLWRGEGEALARLRPAAGGGFHAHPALLDAAFQILLAILPADCESDDTWLPVGIGEVVLHRPLPVGEACWSHGCLRAAEGGEAEGDLEVLSESGEVLLEVRGLRLRRLARDAWSEIAGWLYETRWEEVPVLPAPAVASGGDPGLWLILADDGGLAREVGALLAASGERCRLVSPEDGIDPADPQGFAPLLAELRETGEPPLRGVVHLWSLWPRVAPDLRCLSALHLVRALLEAGGPPVPLWLVTDRAQPADGTVAAPEAATLWGFARVLAAEHPELRCTRVDVDAREAPAAALVAEIHSGTEEEVALRGGIRRVPRLVRGAAPDASADGAVPLRADGTYLVTGGMGGLGLEVARWMAGQGAGCLLLAGRREPSPEAWRAIAGIEALGARVVTARADVSRRPEVEALLARVAAGLPPLRGVLHAAGVLDDGLLLQQTAERFRAVLAPKVEGARHLHELTAEAPLDFFVLFSSATAVLGLPGQGSYAAANACLDALAHFRRGRGLAALSIQWGAWAEVGLASREARSERLAERGVASIRPARGCEALGWLLRHAAPEVAVMAVDWPRWFQAEPAQREAPLLRRLAAEAAAGEAAAEPEDPGSLDPEERPRWLETHLRREASAVLRLPQARLDEPRTLTQLGLDSLMALELKRRIDARIGASVSVARLLQGVSFRQLVDQIREQVLGPIVPPAPLAGTEGGAWEEIEL